MLCSPAEYTRYTGHTLETSRSQTTALLHYAITDLSEDVAPGSRGPGSPHLRPVPRCRRSRGSPAPSRTRFSFSPFTVEALYRYLLPTDKCCNHRAVRRALVFFHYKLVAVFYPGPSHALARRPEHVAFLSGLRRGELCNERIGRHLGPQLLSRLPRRSGPVQASPPPLPIRKRSASRDGACFLHPPPTSIQSSSASFRSRTTPLLGLFSPATSATSRVLGGPSPRTSRPARNFKMPRSRLSRELLIPTS